MKILSTNFKKYGEAKTNLASVWSNDGVETIKLYII